GRIVVNGVPTAANLRITMGPDDSGARVVSLLGDTYRQIALFQPAIQSDGTFLIPIVPPGRYRFQIALGVPPARQTAQGGRGTPGSRLPQTGLTALPAGAYVADIRQGGASVYDNGILIDSNSGNTVEVQIATNPGSIEGTLVGSDRKPVAEATVVL